MIIKMMMALDYLFELALSEILRFSQFGETMVRGIRVKQGITETMNQHRNDEIN